MTGWSVWCLSHRLELALKDSLDNLLTPVKNSLTNVFYMYPKSSKKLRELRKLHTVLKDMYEFDDNRVKPAKSSGTRWIAHLLRSMSGLIDKFGLYLRHFENVMADTSKQTDKATLEGKRKLLTDSEALLRCGLFVDLLDPAKKFSLVSQKNFGIIELVEELDDMFLAYYLMKRRFESNPEAIFSLPYLPKVISGVKVEQNENGTLCKYQDITLQYYEREKEIIGRNTTKYIDIILEALTERFGALSEENDHGEDRSGTAIAGDSILRDVCRVLDSRKWIVPEGIAITLEAVDAMLEKNIESLSKIFYHFTEIFKKISPAITNETIISLVTYKMKNYTHLIHTLLKMWQLLNPFKNERGWNNIFLTAEFCF